MSITTRREKRRREHEKPIRNDWLWRCPAGTPTRVIKHALRFTDEPVFEWPADVWETPPRALLHASYDQWPRQFAVLHGFLCVWHEPGLFIIRRVPSLPPNEVKLFVEITGGPKPWLAWSADAAPDVRVAIVLDGWREATFRIRSRLVYAINPLLPGM